MVFNLLFFAITSLLYIFKASFITSFPPVGYNTVPSKIPLLTNSIPPLTVFKPSTPMNLILSSSPNVLAVSQALNAILSFCAKTYSTSELFKR